MVFTPHDTAGNEKISLTNSTGTAADAIAITATAGSLDLNAGDNITDAADEISITTTSAGHITLTSAHTSGVAFHIDANADATSEVQIDGFRY